MDIKVCGTEYTDVRGVKATDADGNTVVFSACSGDFAVANVTLTNSTSGEYDLPLPVYRVMEETKLITEGLSLDSGETTECFVVYPVGGYTTFITPATIETTGEIVRNYDEVGIGGDGTITVVDLPK